MINQQILPLALYHSLPPCVTFRRVVVSLRGPEQTRSSLRMLRWVAAFCRPLRPVLLLVSFPHSWSPAVGMPGLCGMWQGCAVGAPHLPGKNSQLSPVQRKSLFRGLGVPSAPVSSSPSPFASSLRSPPPPPPAASPFHAAPPQGGPCVSGLRRAQWRYPSAHRLRSRSLVNGQQ